MSAWSTFEFDVIKLPKHCSVIKALREFADARAEECITERCFGVNKFAISISEENENAMSCFSDLLNFLREKKIVIDGTLSIRILT